MEMLPRTTQDVEDRKCTVHSPSLVTPQVQAPVSVAPLPAHPTSAAVVQDARLLLGFMTISSLLDTGARRFHADLFALTSLILEVRPPLVPGLR